MLGAFATTCTMSAMAAPNFDHKNPPPAHFDQKPNAQLKSKAPEKPAPKFAKDLPHKPAAKFAKDNAKKPAPKFDAKRDQAPKHQGKNTFAKDVKAGQGPDRKAPPMPPKHR